MSSCARVAGLANADVVDIDDRALVEERDRHRARVRAKRRGELLLRSLQRVFRASPHLDLRLERQVLARDLLPALEALLQRLLRLLVVLDEEQHEPDARPVDVHEVEQEQLRPPRDDRIDDRPKDGGLHDPPDERRAIEALRRTVDQADPARNQAGARTGQAPA